MGVVGERGGEEGREALGEEEVKVRGLGKAGVVVVLRARRVG